MQFVMIFSLILAVLAVVFALQNTAMVTLSFFIWTFESPLALLLLIALTIGAIITTIVSLPGWLKARHSTTVHKREVAGMEESLAKYRTDLIDTQNKNKDLRQKIIEVEEAKETLAKAQEKTLHEVDDLRAALNNSQLTAEQAEIARQEAIEARAQMDKALLEMDERLASVTREAERADGANGASELLPSYSETVPHADAVVSDAAGQAEPLPVSDDELLDEPLEDENSKPADEEHKPHHFW